LRGYTQALGTTWGGRQRGCPDSLRGEETFGRVKPLEIGTGGDLRLGLSSSLLPSYHFVFCEKRWRNRQDVNEDRRRRKTRKERMSIWE